MHVVGNTKLNERKTISISLDTYRKLSELGTKSDTFDSIISDLIKSAIKGN
jgi:predicted CopG family antitoxin